MIKKFIRYGVSSLFLITLSVVCSISSTYDQSDDDDCSINSEWDPHTSPQHIAFERSSNGYSLSDIRQAHKLWIEGIEEGNLEKLKQSIKEKKPKQEEVNWAFVTSVEKNHKSIMEWLLTRPTDIFLPDQIAVNKAFSLSVEKENISVMEWLITPRTNIPLPGQNSINDAFAYAARNNNLNILEFLVFPRPGVSLPNQDGLNHAFLSAADNNHQNIIEWLLIPRPGIPFPNQTTVNFTFQNVTVTHNMLTLMEWLLKQPSGIPLPDQNGVTDVFNNIRRFTHNYIYMKWLLAKSNVIPLPDQETIISIYRDLCRQYNQGRYQIDENLLISMDRLVPVQERINQGRAPRQILEQMIPDHRMASEVHDYADARVPRANSSGRNSPSKTQRLFDAVLSTINTRIQRFSPVKIDLIGPRLLSAIEHIYAGKPEQSRLATQALENGYAYENAPLYLQKVLTFLDHLPTPELKFNLWFKGFIEESIEAYKNSLHQLSCTQGIEERILTGLRNVDEELDLIFKHAEAPFLMKKFVENNFNMGSHDGIQKVSHLLKTLGVLPSTSVNDAKKVLSDYINRELGVHQIPIPLNVQEYVSYAIQAFEDIYDEKIKPLL